MCFGRPVTFLRASLCCALVLGGAVKARAQASLQVPLQFDFLNPGARSLALGSAFAGLADDATAAFTNPAGLTQLFGPEVSLEVRNRRTETPFLFSGRLSGSPTNRGIDTIMGPVYGLSVDKSTGVSFVSLAFVRGRWALAGYRHELVRLSEAFETTGVFQQDQFGVLRELPLQATRDLSITAYGGSGAYRINDKLSIGGGLTVYTFDLNSRFSRYAPPDFFGTPSFAATQERGRSDQTGEDTALGGSIGLLWSPDSKVRIGGVARLSPSFGFNYTEGDIGAQVHRTGVFQVPNSFTLGVMVRPIDVLSITADYVRVQYSDLENDFIKLQAGPTRASNFSIEDGNEFHAGIQYAFSGGAVTPIVRGGAWYDPAHSIKYAPDGRNLVEDERFSAYLPSPGGEWHYTFGGGVTVKKLEVNAAADLANTRRFVSFSAVVRF